jgi:uncharacterized protein (TIGR03086 family)
MQRGRTAAHTGVVPDENTTDALDRLVNELIGLGRDREAATLAGTLDHQGGTMDVLQQLDRTGNALANVVGGITPDQLDNPTPCDRFTVRGVLGHMISGATMFTAAFREEAADEPDLSEPLRDFGPCLGGLVSAINAPGALDREIDAPWGKVTGADFAQFIVLDGTVHGYDLATATGQDYAPDDALVQHLIAFAGPALAGMRDGDTFKEPTEPPVGATPIQRLAALTGRTVV